MLIEFRVKNFRSFKEEQVFSMVASKDDSLSDNVVEVAGWRLLRTAAIYGANASGKSNLLKAIRAMGVMVQMSAQMDAKARNNLAPFAMVPKNRSEPCWFEVTFLIEDVRYQYGFSASRQRVHDEWLLSYPEGKARQLFVRKYDRKSKKTKWDLESRYLTGQKKKLKSMVRDDALFLSIAAQFNHAQLTPIHDFFRSYLRSILTTDGELQVTREMMLESAQTDTQDAFKDRVLSQLRLADPTICGVRVEKLDPDKFPLPKDLPDDARKTLREQYEANPAIRVEFEHVTTVDHEHALFPLQEESDGTRRLFQLMGPIQDTLDYGLVVFVDEIESSLHPLLVRRLLQDLQSPKSNPQGAQVIMTTHDTTLLDPELLRRDQIWFTEKDGDGATHLYSLSDYKEKEKGKARKDDAFQKRYLEGRYGAIPIIERFELNEPKAS